MIRRTGATTTTTTTSTTAAQLALRAAAKPTATASTTTASTTSELRAQPAIVGEANIGAVWPTSLDSDLALLSDASRAAIAKLFLVVGNDRGVRDDVVDALSDAALWCVPMRPTDEARVLAAAMAAVPVSKTTAKTPMTPINGIEVITAQTDGKTAVQGALDLVKQAWSGGADVVIAPEWFFVPADGVALSRTAKDALVTTLAELTRGSDRLLVPGTIPWADDDGGYHNTAFAFCDGHLVKEVDKRGDGDDVDIANSAGLTHAARPADSRFAWRGVDVGLEVCRDHGDARLRWELLGGPRDVVDLHLVVSSGVWLKHAAVGVAGHAVVAQGDGVNANEHLVRAANGRFDAVTPDA